MIKLPRREFLRLANRQPNRARERLAYVLTRMREDGVPDAVSHAEAPGSGLPPLPAIVASARPRRDIGFHFVDQVAREAKTVAGLDRMTDTSYTVRSTIDQPLQRAVEEALQEGLARYERDNCRAQFMRPEANLGATILRLEADRNNADRRPFWQQALTGTQLALYDVHWVPAVVVARPTGKRGDSWRVGLPDGRILPLMVDGTAAQNRLALNDVVLVHLEDGSKAAARAELRVRPAVQGTVVVLENKTGRILAMTGGFSYPLTCLSG
jgi:penicillin-binding protein 1A